MVNSLQAVSKTHEWIVQFIIKLNICPFAARPHLDNLIAYRVYEKQSIEEALQYLARLMEDLDSQPAQAIETSFLILPNMFSDFDSFWSFLEMGEAILMDLKLEGIIQIVPFHPLFQFADAPADDPANFTNRSPFPMIHLLREESVYQAIQNYKDTASIPVRNSALLRSMKLNELKAFSSK